MRSFTTNELELVAEPIAIKTWSEKRRIYIELVDERIISFPASRFKLLINATDDALTQVQLRLNGKALRWENLDEDFHHALWHTKIILKLYTFFRNNIR